MSKRTIKGLTNKQMEYMLFTGHEITTISLKVSTNRHRS